MSTAHEGQVTDGGTRCFGTDVSTTEMTASRTFVIAAVDATCLDGEPYPYKAIVFDDGLAIAVRCITADDAARLRAARAAGTADVKELSTDEIQTVAAIITCPPLAPGGGTTAYELDVQQRLGQLTSWAAPLLGGASAKAPAQPSAA